MLQLILTVQILVSVNTRATVMYAYDAKGTHSNVVVVNDFLSWSSSKDSFGFYNNWTYISH